MVKKILIADDEPHMLLIIELSLKKLGYTLIPATNGIQAVDLAGREKPALIVMDVNMPEMDGLTALEKLKSSPGTAEIPVIMLTTRGQTLAREQAENFGATLFLTKPFSPSLLADAAKRLIG